MKKKAKKDFGEATRASVKKELAKPRMTKSAREGQINPAAARNVLGKPGKNKLQSRLLLFLRRSR
jgi:hypothetical protein